VVFSLRRAATHRHPIPLPSKTPESERPFIAHPWSAPACVYHGGDARSAEEDARPSAQIPSPRSPTRLRVAFCKNC